MNILSEEFINELNQLETIEANMLRKQKDDKNLLLMFILDMLFYFLFSFPYTLMRLILDLFVKDQVKISLDFFILFKSSLLAFHIHLIAKFFLMVTLNQNYRKCLGWAFSIQNSRCWQKEKPKNEHRKSGSRQTGCWRRFFTCCFCCGIGAAHRERRWLSGSASPTDSNIDVDTSVNLNKDYTSCSLDDDNFYHSTEFNSNFHQFYCPAEPNESDLIPNLLEKSN